MTLLKKYISEGKLTEALLVGRNALNKNPGDEKVFEEYFSYLCSLAERLPRLSERQNFAEQAGVALAFYKENADLSEDIVAKIGEYEKKIGNICNGIDEVVNEAKQNGQNKTYDQNRAGIKQLYLLKDKLASVQDKVSFDKILSEIGALDSTLEKDVFTNEQIVAYDALTKEHTELISLKMREIEHKDNVLYNKKAAEAFASAFKQFRDNEGKYKNQTQLFALASTTLFAFDAAKLFNETLIYYNHVYSYIFSKLDDDGKLALTRYSIECERKIK